MEVRTPYGWKGRWMWRLLTSGHLQQLQRSRIFVASVKTRALEAIPRSAAIRGRNAAPIHEVEPY